VSGGHHLRALVGATRGDRESPSPPGSSGGRLPADLGGDGAPFNVGEATVTRAIVELPSGERGWAHILGRDAERARLAAILDALWQKDDCRPTVEAEALAPIAARLAAERAKTDAETAATRVNFFTLVRGEDGA